LGFQNFSSVSEVISTINWNALMAGLEIICGFTFIFVLVQCDKGIMHSNIQNFLLDQILLSKSPCSSLSGK